MPNQPSPGPGHPPEPASVVATRFTDEYGPPVAGGGRLTWTLGRTGVGGEAVTVVLSTAPGPGAARVSIFAPHRTGREKVVRTLVGQGGEVEALVRAIGRRRVA